MRCAMGIAHSLDAVVTLSHTVMHTSALIISTLHADVFSLRVEILPNRLQATTIWSDQCSLFSKRLVEQKKF